MMPVSMLVIGAEIAGMNIKTVIGHKSAYSVSMLRMILFPILTYVVMKIINVDFEVRATAVILAAMPSGSLTVIMAQKYKNNIEFATSAVMQNHRENPGEGDNYFVDIYRFEMDVKEEDVHIQTAEAMGFQFADLDTIKKLAEQDKFLHYNSIKQAFEA